MPLLEPNAAIGINPLTRQVVRLKVGPRQMILQIISQWEQLFDLLWGSQESVTPAQRLEGIGTNGAELLQRSADLVTFCLTQLQGEDADLIARIQAKVASMPALTVATDGTVTINP